VVGTARIEVLGDTAWWVRRAYGLTGKLEDGVFVTEYSSIPQLASWVLRQNGRAVPLEPHELKQEVGAALRRVKEAHEGAPPEPAREKQVRELDGPAERPAGPVAPERFAVLQALLAYLLAACGEEREAEIPSSELLKSFPSIPADELEEHLSLLNLVNFGGGCYTVYAELRDDSVHVDKELWGDTFRAAPRLTPLEARAIRLALEYVGPMIAADAHSPLTRVRKKLEETFGQFDLERTPEPHVATEEVDLVSRLARGMRDHRLVEIEYQKEVDSEPSTRLVEPYSFGRELPNWYVHTWDRTSGGERSFRLDRMRSATLTKEKFDPRPGFEPTKLRNARTARILYTEAVARFAAERGARRLTDGTALAERPYGDDEWLETEILAGRGDAVLLEPDELRHTIAARAKALAKELGVERLRVRA
jgi:proteasome accessory factor C